MNKHWLVFLFATVIALLSGYFAYKLQSPSQPTVLSDQVYLQHDLGGDFTLVRHDGKTVTAKDFHGEYLLIYFGYSYCPDICPTSLIQIVHAINALDPEQQKAIRPVFITVDPERDTVEEVAAYIADFDQRMIGLTGTAEQISAMAKQYKVYARKNGSEEDIANGTYLVDHSSFFYLIKPDGAFSHLFSSRINTKTLTSNISKIIQ